MMRHAEAPPTAHPLERTRHRVAHRSASSVRLRHLVPTSRQMPLRGHPTPVLVPPPHAVNGVPLPPPLSIAT
jgi:hypothetical protein